MCQCLLCDCWWCNFCGVPCGGVGINYLCFSLWCCKADDYLKIDPTACHCCEFVGIGGNCFCFGDVCCAPEYLKQWSKLRANASGPQSGAPK